MSENTTPMSATEVSPEEEISLRQRVAKNPRPALLWVGGTVLLLALEFGALVQVGVDIAGAIVNILPSDPGGAVVTSVEATAEDFPTLLTRELIPNQGYKTGPNGPWKGTFLGLEPKHAWLVRVALIYAYAFAWLGWIWYGYLTFRRNYRYAGWTPRDDMVNRMRGHRWGQFGFVVVVFFLVMAMFAPALGPTTVDQNILNPYSHEINYWNADSGEVDTVVVGVANIQAKSKGSNANVGPWSYDEFGRFHPLGTLTTGKDLFTFMAHGARISLAIGVLAMGTAGLFALFLATLTAYYKGLVDLFVVLTSDSVQALPLLMVLILASVVFSGTWLAELYDGSLLLAVLLAVFYWPFLWRAVRGPAFQVSEQEWIDAARSYGQAPWKIMQKHMTPYIIGYMLVYASLSLGGVIISVAGLSFLGLGINPPTPEWGRAISEGQPYVATASWHISFIPGFAITLVVTAFNALGDGIRDAIDPESEGARAGSQTAAAGGGGG